MRKVLLAPAIVGVLSVAGCSLQQTKVIDTPNPSGTKTVIVHPPQALAWNVTWSYYAANNVRLNYPLCPGQKVVGRPHVKQDASNVSITLLATQATCANPVTKNITVQLGKPLGNRPLTNPALLQ
ncbi:MAG: hypothetical protein ACTHJM_15005 [Marmoricola sp.]